MLPGSIVTPVKKLKLTSCTAFKNGWIASDPFAGYRYKVEYRDRRFLSESEPRAVMNAQLPDYETAIVRGIFCEKMSHDDIHTDERGDGRMIDKRQKTGTRFRVKPLSVAKELAERYRSLRLPENEVFPVKDRDSTNMSLRHVARHAELSFSLTIHTARRPFSTAVTLPQGVSLETVGNMLVRPIDRHDPAICQDPRRQDRKGMDALSERIAGKFRMAQQTVLDRAV